MTQMNLRKIFAVYMALSLPGQSLLASAGRSDEMRIGQVRGDVKICDASNNCSPATQGQTVRSGMTVRAGRDGWARMEHGKDVFEVKERSRILVDQIKPNGSRLELLIGSLKSSVNSGLFRRRDVSVVTPVGVMAVRGTEFLCSADNKGNTQTDVLFGQVDLVDPNSGATINNFIQGESGTVEAVGKPGAETGPDVAKGDESGGEEGQKGQAGQGGEGGDKGKGEGQGAAGKVDRGSVQKGSLSDESFQEAFGGAEGFKSHMEVRQETQQKANNFATQEAAGVANVVQVVREDGAMSGRTLRDMHGNLVRVEQMLMRPDSETVQFINLVKRDSYEYKGFYTPLTKVPAGVRKDYAEIKITFNKNLPEEIQEWPTFFSKAGDTLKVKSLTTELANNTDGKAKDYLRFESALDPAKNQIGDTVCRGATTNFKTDCFNKTVIGVANGTDADGTAKYSEWMVADCNSTTCGTASERTSNGEKTKDLWATAEAPINVERVVSDELGLLPEITNLTLNNGKPEFWLQSETRVINNSGETLNFGKLMDSNISDPFSFLKTIGIEMVFTVNKHISLTPTGTVGDSVATSAVFQRGNIDLVLIPDYFVDLAQKFAGTLSGL